MMLDSMFGERTMDIMDNAIPDLPRLAALWKNAKVCSTLDGAFAEFGVYKGGTALLMYEAAKRQKAIHLFDTFSGMPADDIYKKGHRKDDFNDTSVEYVRNSMFREANNVLIHRGFFPGTTEHLNGMRYSLVHIDADLYQSTKDGIAYFWPRLVQGGRLVFDDFGWDRCPGVEKAIVEFMRQEDFVGDMMHILSEAPYQKTIIKLHDFTR
jgi:O-methyltransferase